MTRRARLRRKIRKSPWRQARQLRARHYRTFARQLRTALHEGQP